jgi:aldose 1-epimerase
MKKINAFAGIFALFFVWACNNSTETSSSEKKTTIDSAWVARTKAFQQTLDGKEVNLFILKNKKNATAELTNYGARLVSLFVPDKNGDLVDVTPGYDSLAGYTRPGEPFFGASVGRYANRIANAAFKLDGKAYKLAANNGPNTLHGGLKGFDKMVWDATQKDPQSIVFSYVSKDGEEGFPGTLTSKITFTLTDENAVQIDYEATTDTRTIVNLTNHAYFNLNGAGTGTINDHELMINADNILPVNATLIPTGKPMKVEGTPFDFRQPAVIGSRIDTTNEQIRNGKGFDHNYVLNGVNGQVNKVATAKGNISGITMEVYTDQPGLQFYGGNFLNATKIGKGGKVYDHRNAFCLEAGHYPDSPNQPAFPSTVLNPGETYKQTTIYKFF